MRLWISAFEPFDGDTVNPSEQLLEALFPDGAPRVGVELHKSLLPVSFSRMPAAIDEAIASFKPNHILHLGYAKTAEKIRLERFAHNLIHARIADNDGAQPLETRVIDHGAVAFETKFPLTKWTTDLFSSQESVEVSHDAGAYVCNACYYHTLHNYPEIPTLFVHIPAFDVIAKETQLKTLETLILAGIEVSEGAHWLK